MATQEPIKSLLTAKQIDYALMESRNDFPSMCTAHNSITERYTHMMPSDKNITQVGELLWTPTPQTKTGFTSIRTNDTDATLRNPNALLMDWGSTTGYTQVYWGGLSIPIPSDGMIDWLFMGITGNSADKIKLYLTSATGQISYEFKSSNIFWGRQTTLTTWNAANTVADFVMDEGGNEVIIRIESGDFYASSTITTVSLEMGYFSAGGKMLFDGAYSRTKITPIFAMTFDTSSTNVIDNFCPIWKEKGFGASLRVGGDSSYWIPSWLSMMKGAYLDGFDIYNGSYSRTPLSGATIELTMKEMAVAQNMIRANGFTNPILFSTIGNQLPSHSVRRAVAEACGIKWCKAPVGFYNVNLVGPNGIDDPTYTKVKGAVSYTNFIKYIDGLTEVGGYLMSFAHECVDFYTYDEQGNITGLGAEATSRGLSAGDELTTTSTASGGAVWTEAMQALADYMEPLVDAGELKVVGITELDLIMRGLA